jgi:hypothetical protein
MLHLSYTTSVISEVMSGESEGSEDIWQRVKQKMRLPNVFNVGIHLGLLGLFFYAFVVGITLV